MKSKVTETKCVLLLLWVEVLLEGLFDVVDSDSSHQVSLESRIL